MDRDSEPISRAYGQSRDLGMEKDANATTQMNGDRIATKYGQAVGRQLKIHTRSNRRS